ncbi:MAG: type III-A CRISPR-associated RAMP protein Csm5 [Spirochaetes bacterium]|nr:type III-A CRISPR-associated RAMP protein Csm5 [Spirochaetota bacterium]
MKWYSLTIEPLTVLHIGTGNTVEPHEYTIYEKNQSPLYLRIDFNQVFENLKDEKVRKKLLDVLTQTNDFVKFRTTLQKELPEYFEKHFIYGSHVTKEFVEEFNEKFSNPNNQLAVLETYRPPHSKVPFIPGSSIKGAIRTAILNKIANSLDATKQSYIKQSASRVRNQKVDTEFQKHLLEYEDAKEDPFRTLRISDGKVQGKRAMLVGIAYNFSLKNGIPRDSTIPIYMEVVRGTLADGDATIKVKMSMQPELVPVSITYEKIQGHNPNARFRRIPFEIKLDDLIKACNTFYKKVWQEEFRKFYQDNINTTNFGAWESLNEAISSIGNKDKEFLLRIGRFSHFEAVTVEKFRIAPKGYGKSRGLFSYKHSLLPMGWVKASIDEGE